MRYVLGFAFTTLMDAVLLIQKKRPQWQAGCYNGIGGKIEPQESALAAMVREFKEETGVGTLLGDWHRFAVMQYQDAEIVCYVLRSSEKVKAAHTTTDEEVVLCDSTNLPPGHLKNIRALVELAKLPLVEAVELWLD